MSKIKKNGKKISLMMDSDILTRLNAYAKENGLTRTAAIEKILESHLDNDDSGNQLKRYKEVLKDKTFYDAGAWIVLSSPNGALSVRDKRVKGNSINSIKGLSFDHSSGFFYYMLGEKKIYLDFEKKVGFTIINSDKEPGRFGRYYFDILP